MNENVTRHEIQRIYTVSIPNDRHEYDKLVVAMLTEQPEISTGNYGDPNPDWIEEQLIIWLTHQYDKGKYEDLVEVEIDMSYVEPQEKYDTE